MADATELDHERAHEMAGAPVCPRCGRLAEWFGPPSFAGYIPDNDYPVHCRPCKWYGVAVRVRRRRTDG